MGEYNLRFIIFRTFVAISTSAPCSRPQPHSILSFSQKETSLSMNWNSLRLRRTLERPTCHLKYHSSPNLNGLVPMMWPICTRWVGPSAVGSKGEDRMDKQTSRLLIFLGKQIIRGIWQLLTFPVMGGEGKTNFEISGFQRLGVSIPESAFWEGDWVSRSSSKEQG